MILAYSPSLDRDIDLTRASASELAALRQDMASPLWHNAAPGIRRAIEAAVNAQEAPAKPKGNKNPGAELSYEEKEQLLKDMKGPEVPEPESKDPRYGYKLPLTSSLILAAEQISKGPDASQGDTKENAIDFINANGSAMDDYTVQQLREALTSAGYTQQVADAAITELLGQEALLALATPVKELLVK